jgi:hypothetical protein
MAVTIQALAQNALNIASAQQTETLNGSYEDLYKLCFNQNASIIALADVLLAIIAAPTTFSASTSIAITPAITPQYSAVATYPVNVVTQNK